MDNETEGLRGTDRQMDRKMEGGPDRVIKGQTDGLTENRGTDGWTVRQMNGVTDSDRETEGHKGGQRDGQTDGQRGRKMDIGTDRWTGTGNAVTGHKGSFSTQQTAGRSHVGRPETRVHMEDGGLCEGLQKAAADKDAGVRNRQTDSW